MNTTSRAHASQLHTQKKENEQKLGTGFNLSLLTKINQEKQETEDDEDSWEEESDYDKKEKEKYINEVKAKVEKEKKEREEREKLFQEETRQKEELKKREEEKEKNFVRTSKGYDLLLMYENPSEESLKKLKKGELALFVEGEKLYCQALGQQKMEIVRLDNPKIEEPIIEINTVPLVSSSTENEFGSLPPPPPPPPPPSDDNSGSGENGIEAKRFDQVKEILKKGQITLEEKKEISKDFVTPLSEFIHSQKYIVKEEKKEEENVKDLLVSKLKGRRDAIDTGNVIIKEKPITLQKLEDPNEQIKLVNTVINVVKTNKNMNSIMNTTSNIVSGINNFKNKVEEKIEDIKSTVTNFFKKSPKKTETLIEETQQSPQQKIDTKTEIKVEEQHQPSQSIVIKIQNAGKAEDMTFSVSLKKNLGMQLTGIGTKYRFR